MKSILTLALMLHAALAAADPHAKAEALFRQGRDLMAAKKFGDACAAFDASQKLDPATTTLFNQADCREKNGQLATAWALFVEAERQTRDGGAVGEKLHQVATQRASKLAGRLSKLTLHVTNPPDGLTLTRDGEVVDKVEWNRALPVDGGTYKLAAKLADREVWSQTITMGTEGGVRVVEIIVTPPAVPLVPPVTAPTPAPVGVPPVVAPVVVQRSTPSRSGAKLATAGAAVMLGGALGFELWGRSTYNRAKADNDVDRWTAANHQRYAGEAFLAGGVAFAGVAAYLWLRDDGTEKRHVAPIVDAHAAGVSLSGRW